MDPRHPSGGLGDQLPDEYTGADPDSGENWADLPAPDHEFRDRHPVIPAAGHPFSGETGHLYGSCYIRTYHGDGGMSRLLYRNALHAAVLLPAGMVSGIRIREKCGGKPVLSVPPALSIGLGMVAMNAKNLRAAMIAAYESNYILTARAKGLSNRRVILYHTLKNALVPYFTISGIEIASMLGSTSIIERTFSISGIGSLLVDAVAKNDYPVVQGVTLVIVVLVLLINLAVDVLSALMDPRIRVR